MKSPEKIEVSRLIVGLAGTCLNELSKLSLDSTEAKKFNASFQFQI